MPGCHIHFYVEISDDVLRDKFLYNGNVEIYFDVIVTGKNGEILKTRKYLNVEFQDAFQLDKVHVDFTHKTWFSGRKWVFNVDSKCFVPKWVNCNLELLQWDIESQGTIINILVSEEDPSTTTTFETDLLSSRTTNFELENNFTVSGGIGNAECSGSVKTSYGVSNKSETTTKYKYTRSGGSDDFGSAVVYYTSPVILSKGTQEGKAGYYVKEIQTGYVTMLVVPRYR